MLGKNLIQAAAGAGAAGGATYVEDVFSTWLYTGNGSTQTITNGIDLAGEGGMVWIKRRNSVSWHFLTDSERGTNKQLVSNEANTGETYTNFVTSFNANGFSLGNNTSANNTNDTYASWTFRKAEKFFDVVTYTGDGTSGRQISHNLGSVPGCIIYKCTSTTGDWFVYHTSLGTDHAFLNYSIAKNGTNYMVAPTSAVFEIGASLNSVLNVNGATYVAYLFAHDAGGFGDSGNENVISCGSFTGTGSVNLGWEPQWLLFKNATATGNWVLVDTMRGWVSDGTTKPVSANSTSAESSVVWLNVNSTGFSHSSVVIGSGTYIYIAIRRGPMKTPEDATTVFSAIAATASTSTTRTTGFPIDLQIGNDRSRLALGGSFFNDRLRGVSTTATASGVNLYSSSTAAESTTALTLGFDNTGFKDAPFYSTYPMAWWNFRRAPGFFDVVAYTGTGSTLSVNHNLTVAPELIVIKNRSGAYNWTVGSVYLPDAWSNPFSQVMYLNTTAASAQQGYIHSVDASIFKVVGVSQVGASGSSYIAYLFATCPGVSKVGSYTGTGTTLDVDCGFTAGARFVLIKRTDSTGDWYVWDTARGIVSGNDPYLLLNSGAAEVTSTDYIDPLSSGFQISSTAPAAINANGGSFIFLAIA